MITIEEKQLIDLLEEAYPILRWCAAAEQCNPEIVGKVEAVLQAAGRLFANLGDIE